MKVHVEQHGIIHYHAYCEECGFEEAIHTDKTPTPQDVRNSVRRHVKWSGHVVTIESGSSTTYYQKNEE